jgi:hypothetical protein
MTKAYEDIVNANVDRYKTHADGLLSSILPIVFRAGSPRGA